jgi:hypothetical protein
LDRRRRSKRKREADGTETASVAMRDFEVDQLIEDEIKSELPRLDQLKVSFFVCLHVYM